MFCNTKQNPRKNIVLFNLLIDEDYALLTGNNLNPRTWHCYCDP